ncbi:hypothetical protein MJG53_002487 [Ovis ammon polii x Ovis aries]|uniref:Uncharacterized protein n=1 Tax=Ovis ammon polii x Ovis aries TaxID=2918886 RepID=A0ACB9VDP0_9CETA|nr:hypothetical protein MJT46_003815 [Ovis ammon polii x Ovis aries]KAI4588079.1 hypothetical protein MJG53_002487 [Ovis ammon polii x Ovis aries]
MPQPAHPQLEASSLIDVCLGPAYLRVSASASFQKTNAKTPPSVHIVLLCLPLCFLLPPHPAPPAALPPAPTPPCPSPPRRSRRLLFFPIYGLSFSVHSNKHLLRGAIKLHEDRAVLNYIPTVCTVSVESDLLIPSFVIIDYIIR